MPIKSAGIDSLKVELGLPPKKFEGLLGLIITCKDEDSFIDLYRECMPKSLAQIGLKTERIVLKGYDISRLAPGEEGKALVSFFDCLKKEKKGEIYSFLSLSMPYKCLAVTERILGVMAVRPRTIASRNHDIVSKPSVMFSASPMTPKTAHPREQNVTSIPILAQRRISFFTSSRSLNGLSSADITDTTSFFSTTA